MSALFRLNLKNIHLDISKLLEQTVISYLSYDAVLASLGHRPNKRNPLIQARTVVLHRCNVYFTKIEKHDRSPRQTVDFSKGNASSELVGLFTSTG